MEPDCGTMVRSLCLTPAEASIEYSVYCVPVNQVATFLPAKSFTLVMPESLYAGEQHRFRAAGQAEGVVARSDQRLDIQVRATRVDRQIEAGLLIKALGLGDIEAGKLGLRQPLQAQRDLLGGRR